MSDGLDVALAAAGLALLAADVDLVVHDGKVPDGAKPPYVLVYTTVARPGEHPAIPLTGDSSGFVARWICHCAGANATAARRVAQRVRTQLLDVRPVVAGFGPQQVGPIRQVEVAPPVKDEGTGRLVMDAVAVYEVYACL